MIRLILSLILCAAICSPQQILILKKKAGGGDPPAYLVDEDCEGSGTPSGWTNTGSPDWDEATVVLAGSQSLEMASAATAPRAHYDTGSAYSEVWLRFKFRATNVNTQPSRILSLRVVSGDAEAAWVQFQTDTGRLGLVNGSASAATVGTMSANTTYNVWVRYKAGTGSNSQMSVAWSADGTEPTSGNNFASVSNGTATASVNRFAFRNQDTANSITYYFDDMIVNDSAIGDV